MIHSSNVYQKRFFWHWRWVDAWGTAWFPRTLVGKHHSRWM